MRITNLFTDFCISRPRTAILIAFLLSALAIASAQKLSLKTSNLDLIDQTLPEVENFIDFAQHFGTPNSLVIVFSGAPAEELVTAVQHAAQQLRQSAGVRKVLEKTPLFELDQEPKFEYLSNHDQSSYYIFLQPEDITTDVMVMAPLIQRIQEIVRDSLVATPEVQVGYTGIPRYSLDDQEVIQRDISRYSLLSLVLIALIFILAFHNIRRPLLAVGTLLLSVLLTLGVISCFPGHLTLLSAPFAMMIFGLGIDYGIHLINLIEEKLTAGVGEKVATAQAVSELTRTLATACLTSVAVMFVLTMSSFLGFRELGFIAGIGLLLCLVLMLTVFPALLSLSANNTPAKSKVDSQIGRLALWFQKPMLAPLAVSVSLALLLVPLPQFDSDYLNLQPKDSQSVRLERDMVLHSDYSPYFAAFVVDSMNEASSLAALLRSYEEIGMVRTLTDFITIPHLSDEEIERISRLPADKRPRLPEIEIPKEYQGIFENDQGEFAVYAYPAGNIWEPEIEQAFLDVVTEIDPSVTGMPILGKLMISRTKQALFETAVLALLALLVILAIDLKSTCLVLITAAIPILSIAWMHALMRLFGIPYNPLNIMALPIVIGISVDDSVHIVHRFIRENGNLEQTLISSGRSVVLTTMTTLAAFTSLALTSHQGLRSFSIILSLGITAALLLSLTALPWLLLKCQRRIILERTLND